MSIETELTTLANTKSSIKTAIEAKGVTVGAVPFADYADKIAEITGGGGSYNPTQKVEWSSELHTAIYDTAVADAQLKTWTRPTDWLSMPSISATDQRFDGLLAVYNNESNWVVVSATGAFTVNWGDGSAPQDFASGAVASKNIAWADINSSTVTTEGFRQAIITVTPQSGQTLSSITLGSAISGLNNNYTVQWRDMQLAMNNAGTFTFGTAGTNTRPRSLKKFRWLGTNSQTNFSNFFKDLRSIEVIEMSTAGATNTSYMFENCYSLKLAPTLNMASVTDAQRMFLNCFTLITVPPMNMSVLDNANNMFEFCLNLITIGTWTSAANNGMDIANGFKDCNNLLIVPDFANFRLNNCGTMFQNCWNLVCVSNLTIDTTSTNNMFENCYNLETIKSFTSLRVVSNNITNMFYNCKKLVPPVFDCTGNDSSANAFRNSGLQTIQGYNFDTVTENNFRDTDLEVVNFNFKRFVSTISNPFGACYKLKEVNLICDGTSSSMPPFTGLPNLKKATVVYNRSASMGNSNNIFFNCTNLETVTFSFPNTGKIQTNAIGSLVSGCTNLKEVFGLEFDTSTTTINSAFLNCPNLSKLTLTGLVASVIISNCAFGPQALEDIFTSLGTASAKTITITGNWGAALLTQEQRDIAINKGWTIVG